MEEKRTLLDRIAVLESQQHSAAEAETSAEDGKEIGNCYVLASKCIGPASTPTPMSQLGMSELLNTCSVHDVMQIDVTGSMAHSITQ